MYIVGIQIWITIFKQDTISRRTKFCLTGENRNFRQRHVSILLENATRAGFPATVAAPLSRERKSTFTSMISHGRHDANEDEPLSTKYQKPSSDADETLSVSRTISGQRSIPPISCVAARAFLVSLAVWPSRRPHDGWKDPTVSSALHELF